MAQGNMNNLTTLIKRLEAATSRLEDIAGSSYPADGSVPNTGGSGAVAGAPTAPRSISPPPKPVESLPPSIAAFDELVDGDLKTWLGLSTKLGSVIEGQSKAVQQAFAAQRDFLFIANKAKKPDDRTMLELLKDLQASMEKTDEVKQTNRDPELKDPLHMVADGVGALGWITVGAKPHEHITEMFGGAQMYGNKVLRAHRESPDKTYVEWVQAYYRLFKALAEYAKTHHAFGVAWNTNGIDAKEAAKQVASAHSSSPASSIPPPPPGGVPPPPGPPPPPGLPPPPGAAPAPKKSAADMNAVFDALNQGEGVTRGLKKVDASQMTHKNPSLRANDRVPTRSDSSSSMRGKSPAPPGKKPKPDSMRTKKPPKKELDGNKWIVENFEGPTEMLEIDAEINHSILISRCKNTTIRINGKANAISLDNSSRTSLIIDSLVSSVDVIKCPNFALQVVGTLPTVLLDQVDGATVYLSKDSLNTEIFTSKCSSININLPTEEDYVENPVPEQLRSFVRGGRLVSEIVEHAG
ncbi:hypothetical protein P153DRAFT_368200 [Dothidotthia symphoricarpi CBS 119687]|uniref:Adenylyl cyclase-associated protein n=1 Tax=Dothidotthia symphoricarpi CBS 119687 TaxID=1392245 RepID=A0A6A6A6J9_9PLEO|nr:uncharacterized protein P153DRAFT_368200 [Dothidotthia symphoricarpi CBS 119687]KAF2127612.1 hypothetical protein P153DRAFT_368200 [Dothidotthia symphoricarpi CBS 119687]